MFRVITIEKSHQTTRFRRYHTQQADKQPVSNEPVTTSIRLRSLKLIFFQTVFLLIRPA